MDFSYQRKLVDDIYEKFINSGKTVILAACPCAGKTHMCLDVAQRFLRDYPKAKLLVYTHGQTLLRDQWYETLREKNLKKITCGVITDSKTAVDVVKNNRLILALPQTLAHADLEAIAEIGIRAVISDEAHQRFLAKQVQEQLAILDPDFILGATGTPSAFLAREDYEVVGITIEELLPYGVVADPLIEIVQSNYEYSIDDFDRSTMKLKDNVLSHDETMATLDRLLPRLVKRLTDRRRSNPDQFDWVSGVTSWKQLAEKLQKTMFICNNQRQARDVHEFFAKKGIKSTISISDINDGSEELLQFKNDPETRVFVVVSRGALGFSYTELMNAIDMTGSLNVNRLFQALCRIIRPSKANPKQKKLFIKTTNKEMSHLTYFVMSYTVALSTKDYYYSYTTEYDIDKVPVDPAFMSFMGGGGGGGGTPTETITKRKLDLASELPEVLTFSGLKERKGVGSLAFTSLREVIDRIYRKQPKLKYTEDDLRKLLRKYDSRKEFEIGEPAAYSFILRHRMFPLLQEFFGVRFQWNRDKIMDVARQCKTIGELRGQFPGAYNWAKKNALLEELKQHFAEQSPGDRETAKTAQSIVDDPAYTITEAGLIYRDGKPMKYYFKRGKYVPYVRHNESWAAVPRVIWAKFRGKIPKGQTIRFKEMKPNDRFIGALSNMELTPCRSPSLGLPAEKLRNKTKLTMNDARAIRQEAAGGATYAQLTKKYKISKSSLSYLLNGKTWAEAVG